MTLPNFLIIGAPKGGTTSIFNYLRQHPQVFLCPVKEAGFFWASGAPMRIEGPGAELLKPRIVSDRQRYEALFESAGSRKAVGEASVRYLSEPRSPELIYELIPQAKLIASLRQPADRAFSSFVRNLRDGLEPCRDFGSAIAKERQGKRQGWVFGRYLDKGFYHRSLERYLAFFERRQLFISLFEDLLEDPHALLKRMFRFLEVDDSIEVDLSRHHNPSGVIRNPALRLFWTHTSKIKGLARPLIPAGLRQKASEWMIRDLEKPPFPAELRQELTDYYREDIEKLQDLIGRDLSGWLQPRHTPPNIRRG